MAEAIPPSSGSKAVTLVAAFTLASKTAEELQRESPVLDTLEAVVQLLREQNRLKNVETFQIMMLNTPRRLIRVEQVSQSTLDTILDWIHIHAFPGFGADTCFRC